MSSICKSLFVILEFINFIANEEMLTFMAAKVINIFVHGAIPAINYLTTFNNIHNFFEKFS